MSVVSLNSPEIVTSPVEQTRASSRMSPRYGFVSTRTIIDRLAASGWEIDSIKTRRSRTAARLPFARHMVLMRHPEHSPIAGLDGEQKAEFRLILENSHDGSCALKMRWGMYRFVCSNGLVIGNDAMRVRVRHSRLAPEHVETVVADMVKALPALRAQIAHLATLDVSAEARTAFIRRAFDMRVKARGSRSANVIHGVDYSLPALRQADEGNQALVLINQVQERVIKGGISYFTDRVVRGTARTPGERREPCRQTTREVREVGSLVELNRQVWEMGCELLGA